MVLVTLLTALLAALDTVFTTEEKMRRRIHRRRRLLQPVELLRPFVSLSIND